MKKYLVALLTSLFLSAMPLQAAYSQDVGECEMAPLSVVINDEVKTRIEAEGGTLLSFTTPESQVAILNIILGDMGSPPPFEFDGIYISHPTEDAFNVNILFSKGECAVNYLKRAFQIYSPLFKKA